MKSSITAFLLSLFFILLTGLQPSWSQDLAVDPVMNKAFVQAKTLNASFKMDSAFVILSKLVDQLEAANQLETPFGLRVQFRHAEALEKDQKDDIALQRLQHVKTRSEANEVWDVYANSCLILANLYEKIGRDQDCLMNLRLAESSIKQHVSLDSIYPLFAIRTSSYHRIFSDIDSSIYYAKEVIRTAPIYKQKEEEAVGHMLMGMLLQGNDDEKRLNHFMAGAKLFRQVEDHTGYCYLVGGISGWHFNNGNLNLALAYNDSAIAAANRSISGGFEEHHTISGAYRFRAEIYKRLGLLDSAWHYLKEGYHLELEYIHESNNEKVIEIDAKYKDEKKIQRIAEQEQEIKFERDRRNLLIGIISLILLSGIILSYYYIQLRKANKKTEAQAYTISKNNEALSISLERQIMLQSEVHHRVKNNLQVIISLLDLQKEDIDDPKTKDNLDAMSGRIYSMAAIHEILYHQEDMAQVNLSDYIENLCLHFSNFSLAEKKPVFDIDVSNLFFNLETSMPIGIMLTELLTNSLKYARVEGQKLKIYISLQKQDDGYLFIYKDNGPGFKEEKFEEREGGLGSYLLSSMSRQLNGHIESKNDNGAVFNIFFKEKNNPV